MLRGLKRGASGRRTRAAPRSSRRFRSSDGQRRVAQLRFLPTVLARYRDAVVVTPHFANLARGARIRLLDRTHAESADGEMDAARRNNLAAFVAGGCGGALRACFLYVLDYPGPSPDFDWLKEWWTLHGDVASVATAWETSRLAEFAASDDVAAYVRRTPHVRRLRACAKFAEDYASHVRAAQWFPPQGYGDSVLARRRATA